MTKDVDLNSRATQAGFAELVGVSQQAISQRVQSGQLRKGQTYRTWLKAYCEDLRQEAAGRSGDAQQSLTEARRRESEANANLKELQYFRELGLLVPVSEVEPAVMNWATTARSETTFALEKLISAIKSQHGIDVEQQLINDTFESAFRSIGSYPAGLDGNAEEGGDGMGAGAAASDQAVARSGVSTSG